MARLVQRSSFSSDFPPSREAGCDGQHPQILDRRVLASSSLSTVPRWTSPTDTYADLEYVIDHDSAALSDSYRITASNSAKVSGKKSLIRPERENIDPGHRLWHYREHAVDDAVSVQPSTTGSQPYGGCGPGGKTIGESNLRRGKSVLGREFDQVDPPSSLTVSQQEPSRRRASQSLRQAPNSTHRNRVGRSGADKGRFHCLESFATGPNDGWMTYCFILTCWVPAFVLRGFFGRRTPESQRAWREKIGIVSICVMLMGVVAYLTFGFTETVCGPQTLRIKGGHVNLGSLLINGYDYDFSTWNHPVALPDFNGTTSPLYMDGWMAGGKDASFLFQNVNNHCLNIITPSNNSGITHNPANEMGWYFPCNLHGQNVTLPTNLTGYTLSTNCHTSSKARSEFNAIIPAAQVYYTWDMVQDSTRNLAVYKSVVIDMSLLNWLDASQVNYPHFFDTVKTRNSTFAGRDITALIGRAGLTKYAECMTDVIQVGFVDSVSIGCVASDIVLYVSLVFILGAVGVKFGMAVVFGWFLSWRLGNFRSESYQQRMKRAAEIENWTDDIFKAAPGYLRPTANPSRKTGFLPTTSRFSKADLMLVDRSRPSTTYGMVESKRQVSVYVNKLGPTPPGTPALRNSRSSTALPFRDETYFVTTSSCPFPLGNVVPQPLPEFSPFGYPLVHSICLVTAYSESIDGLRTTLDSLATTDYPNSHKLLLVICDGMVKGSGSKQFTPDVVLGMMHDFVEPIGEVEAHSYVAIADGHKRHNMAKVHAGFYQYDDSTVESSKQQRVPIILVAKVGNALERDDAKPGNRGKRDSQIILMSFLQKVMFDERMTTFEYEFFNAIWRCTGLPPDRYETVLCVDTDTKVFPDSLTRMNACMVNDTEIMGVCGETKIANKSESWVTMIQVFEYYISHHLTKAFESVFGGVTCLPGCFSMYRIKAPKGDRGYWVPILANPDIVEHYSENIVDTLHKKNLLLLGEDRYLSTLMLKTFPKRKTIFCPQAVCKTVVPERFRILLSRRRRWINSTVHNLFELMLVRDLCGTFCFSMQFVVFMDLVGTLVLPAAISFTLYVIMISILPQSITGMEKPINSLMLLAIILGLPGVLIIITSRKITYVAWMLIYLISIPIWNFVLPAYAFWHMDDFTWGETRKIAGEHKETAHGDKEGEFNSKDIVMKRWFEFERERRWKNDTASMDSAVHDVVQRSTSPRAHGSNRYSVVSTSETCGSGSGLALSESNLLFRNSQSLASISLYTPKKTDASISQLALPPARGGASCDASPASSESGGFHSKLGDEVTRFSSYSPYHVYHSDAYRGDGAPILPPVFPSHTSPETYAQPSGYGQIPASEPEPSRSQPLQPPSRGVSLVDVGPVPAGVHGHMAPHDPVRRVSRQQTQHRRRSSSRNDLLSPTSSASHSSQLSPAAAAPPSIRGDGQP